MTVSDAPIIRNITTGVPGLDTVLGGGLREYSFNMVAGAPGAGKTTLVQQILVSNATPERPAIYFTVLGEPTLKMIRYQRQFRCFDPARVPSAVRFVSRSRPTVPWEDSKISPLTRRLRAVGWPSR